MGPELHDLAAAPFLLQERLKAEQHLRIVTVIDRAWVCELEAGGLPLDWRTTESAHRSFFPRREPRGRGAERSSTRDGPWRRVFEPRLACGRRQGLVSRP